MSRGRLVLTTIRLFEYGKAHAAIFIPEGFDDGAKPVEIEFDPVLDAGYKAAARALITSLTAEVVMGIDDIEALTSNFIIEKTKKNRNLPGPLQQSVPGWSIFAMFFIAIPMSIGFLREKNDGTLQRIFTYPINANLIILGKLIPYYLINLIQFALMLIVGIYIMPHITQFALYSGGTSVASNTGNSYCRGGFHRFWRDGGGAGALSGAVLGAGGYQAAVLMGVFGGIMVPHVVMPLMMKKLAMISPMYWAHQAYLDVFLRDAAFSFILPKLAVLALFALLCFYIAGRKVKWM